MKQGYLLKDSAQVLRRSAQGATLRELEELEEVPCLVLLGPPGLGKSFELRGERDRLIASAGPNRVLHVDLKGHSEASFREAVFGHGDFEGWARGAHGLILLLDSLDECWAHIRALIPTLIGKLRQAGLGREGHPPLKLRLGCRAAEWRVKDLLPLREAFGDREGDAGKVQVHQLCPLTRNDVLLAAEAYGLVDAAGFVASLDEMELGVLAAHPLTLELLLADAKEGRPPGPTREAIYRRGLLRLAEDAHEDPAASEPRNPHTLLAERRYEIAARVAAIGVLSRRYLCRMPNGRGESSSQVLEVGDVARAASGQIDRGASSKSKPGIEPRALAETYRCGIFRASAEDCVTWQHQAYAEFLAADHLASRINGAGAAISTRDLLGLVADLSGPTAKVYPPLEELALWLVELRPDLFDSLVAGNASVLLRSDSRTLTPERRSRIVEVYFEQIRTHEAEGEDWEKRLPLERLAHPGLAKQLREVLHNPDEPVPLRRTAVAIAVACGLHDLVDDLVLLMFGTGKNVGVAGGAGRALLNWSRDTGEAGQLVRAAVRARFLDERKFVCDEIRGVVLSILWPGNLTVDELTPHLTHPDSPHRFGMYELFLYQELAQRATDSQVAGLLQWAAKQKLGNDEHRDQRINAVQRLARRAFASTAEELQLALVELALRWVDYRSPSLLKLASDERLNQDDRRRFVARWLTAAGNQEPDFSHLAEATCLIIDPADLNWAVAQALAVQEPDLKKRWTGLVVQLFRRHSPSDVETVWPLVDASADFAAWLATWTTCRIDIPDTENWAKHRWKRQEAEVARKAARPSLAARLADLLQAYESGSVAAFFDAMELFFVGDDERSFPAHDWPRERSQALPVDLLERISRGAKIYWAKINVVDEELREADVIYHKYRTGVLALSYLWHLEPEWLRDQYALWWDKWLPVFLRHQHWFIGEQHTFWPEAFRLAHVATPARFATAIHAWLETGMGGDHLDASLFAADTIASDPLVQTALRTWVQGDGRKSNGAFGVAGLLLRHGDREFEAWLVRTMGARNEKTCDARAAFAAGVLLNFRADAYAERIASEFLPDEAWTRGVLWRMKASLDLPVAWALGLSPELVARLWETFSRMVPHDLWSEGGGLVTFDHELSRLGGYLLNHLESLHSPDAVAAVEGLVARHPDKADWLGRMLARVRHAQRREGWRPLSGRDAADFLDGLGPRPLTTLGDFCDAVLESIARYQAWLVGPNRPTELWNEPTAARKFWEPKEENVVSDCLLNHLARELGPRGVIVTREEETKSGTVTSKADYPDLVVRLPAPDGGNPLRLYVEVKCAWNVEAITGLGEQLLGRYLRTAECGVYVLAHHACSTWNVPGNGDWRSSKPLILLPKAEVAERLGVELAKLRATTGKRLEAFFLDAGLR